VLGRLGGLITKAMKNRMTIAIVALIASLIETAGIAEETALMATYGPGAPVLEGDNDFPQVVFLEVAKTIPGPLYLRLFDPDTGDRHDLIFGSTDTQTRFTLFGGDGVGESRQATPTAEALGLGDVIEEQVFASDPGLDGRWHEFAEIMPTAGEATEDGKWVLVQTGRQGRAGQ